MGLRGDGISGCLLADEMGLGKTLQVITLIWTLLKRGPQGRPAIKRAVVVCPSTLVQNWGNEVKIWLGYEALKAMVVHAGSGAEAKGKFSDFALGKVWPLLITSYELLRKHSDVIASAKPGLLVCDEGHRLKNCAGSKTISALNALSCPRKVILTGTPIQNDLDELFALADFVNPNALGPLSAFRRLYAEPIERSRDRNASDEEKTIGKARSEVLQEKTRAFLLRRTADINLAYLPSKQEYVVFCKLTPLQASLYEIHARHAHAASLTCTTGASGGVLTAISALRKLCNHPSLIRDATTSSSSAPLAECGAMGEISSLQAQIARSFRSSGVSDDPSEQSGKLACLMELLEAISTHGSPGQPPDRTVIVSNFTRTLDIIQKECERRGWQYSRLDGTTDVADRQPLVTRFNAGAGDKRVFLLSAKAGGVGLNLIGASRLVLFDPDWNPATDAQAMARVWREGQQKPVVIYRLLATGSIEEKIYQRQITKGEVAAAVAAGGAGGQSTSGGRHFSREELKEIFTLRQDTDCDTLDLLVRSNNPIAACWKGQERSVTDAPLLAAMARAHISFVHRHMAEEVELCSEAVGPQERESK